MFKKLFILVVLSLLSIACSNERKKDAQSFETVLEIETGQAHSIAKLDTEYGNYVVYKNEVTGEFTAFNMHKWDRETMTTLGQYLVNSIEGVDIVKNLASNQVWKEEGHWKKIYEKREKTERKWDHTCMCYEEYKVTYEEEVGKKWIDTSHWYTYYTGGGYQFENTSIVSKDLDTIAALREEAAQEFIAQRLKSEFSLSTNRAEELAKLASRYQRLENVRELSPSEKDRFAMEALGVSMTQVESALKDKAQGNESKFETLLETAAKTNNTTPEQIGKFFSVMDLGLN